MSFTPLANQLAGLKMAEQPTVRRSYIYRSPVIHGTARPVSRFSLAPSGPIWGLKLGFPDLPQGCPQQSASPPRQTCSLTPQSERLIVADFVAFRKELQKNYIDRLRQCRRHIKARHSLPTAAGHYTEQAREQDAAPHTTGRSVLIRTKPFDDATEMDPWMLFSEWQRPFSPLRNDSQRYLQEEAKALEEEERKIWHTRRGEPLSVEEVKKLNKFARVAYVTPDNKEGMLEEEEVDGDDIGSPMDIDGPEENVFWYAR